MSAKLDSTHWSVNFTSCLFALVVLSACGPSPRPVPPSLQNGWPTTLGNARRAPFESEAIPDSLEVAWDVNAGSGMRATVLVGDSAIFAATTNRQLLAFGVRTGRRYWDQRFEGEIASDIVRTGRTLIFTTSEWNGRVHARDMERGRKIWERNTGPSRFSPLLESGLVYVATDAGWVYVLRSEDGEQVWRRQLPGSTAATPVSHGDALIIATMTDTLYRVAKRDGAVLGRGIVESTASAAPALHGDTLVVVTHSGSVFGLNATTLARLWRVDTGAPILAAPIISRDGAVHVLNRDAAIWRISNGRGEKVAELGGAATTSFTLARDRYVVGKVNGTVVVAGMNGNVISEHHFNESVSAPVAVQAGAVYVPLLRGRIVKLR